MLPQSLLLIFPLLIFFIPILLTGIIILRKCCSIERFELLLPTGLTVGISLFVLLINTISFLFPGGLGIILAYLLTITIGLYFKRFNLKLSKINFPSGKVLIFYLLSFFGWAIFIYWKGNFALIGSDTNLYYSIAHTIIKGNFPPFTPWQPGLPLNYHLGASLLLGGFYYLTGLSFQYLHVFFACLFILICTQIIIWLWGRHKSFFSFFWGNLAAAVGFISFGFIQFVLPRFPLHLPSFSNLNSIVIWLRNLPTVNQIIEVYGAPINLDSLIYFIFHSFGLAVGLSLIVIVLNPRKDSPKLNFVILMMGIISLALINESIFLIMAPALILSRLILEFQNSTLFKNIWFISSTLIITMIIILIQGGMITHSIFPSGDLEKSVLIFPKKDEVKENFTSYHYYQTISKRLEDRSEWEPFTWYHLGADSLILLIILLLVFTKFSPQQKTATVILFISGVTALLAYNFIVPKYLIANGNRFLALAFINLSLSAIYSIHNLIEALNKKKFLGKIITFVLIIFVLLPSILPPLALLTKTRFGENKLIPKSEEVSEGILWMKNNLEFNANTAVLDGHAPHPSGMARGLVQAGVFAPIFPDNFRAYTIEASPEYFEIAYFLSPSALKKLKISNLLIDSNFFKGLPKLRKDQLGDKRYFSIVFDNSNKTKEWEKIYKINDEYYKKGGEIEGGFLKLLEIIPKKGKIYIDDEQNFTPSFLRRAVIFTLRGGDLYFNPGSGIYLNVEVDISFNKPEVENTYDYLVLSSSTQPETICNCRAKIIWKGIQGRVYVWQIVYNL